MAYSEITNEKAIHEAKRLNSIFGKFLTSNGINNLPFRFNETDLLLIIRKVDQRKHYFKEFHNIDMSELKEISLVCFWIIKFRPYNVDTDDDNINDSINEKFCVYLIMHTIRSILKTKGLDESPLNYLTKEYIYQMIYSFRFRDMSKEALILLTETIAIMCGIKPYQNLNIDNIIKENEYP